jgi:phosphate transport system substrate-binding protein
MEPNSDNAYSGQYPISRFLYIYLNKSPNQALDPLRSEFVKYVYSKQGQEAVVKDGYFPVTGEIAKEDLAALGL